MIDLKEAIKKDSIFTKEEIVWLIMVQEYLKVGNEKYSSFAMADDVLRGFNERFPNH